jgi:hypothetical protein
MATNLQALITCAEKFVVATFKDQDGSFQMPATWVVEAPQEIYTVMTPWSDDREKNRAIAAIVLLLAVKEAERYVMATEAWCTRVESDLNLELATIEPRQRHARREVVVLTGVERRSKEKIVRIHDILRDPDGKPQIDPTDDQADDAVEVGGRLADLFDGIPDHPPSQKIVEQFDTFLEILGFQVSVQKD